MKWTDWVSTLVWKTKGSLFLDQESTDTFQGLARRQNLRNCVFGADLVTREITEKAASTGFRMSMEKCCRGVPAQRSADQTKSKIETLQETVSHSKLWKKKHSRQWKVGTVEPQNPRLERNRGRKPMDGQSQQNRKVSRSPTSTSERIQPASAVQRLS